MTNSEQKVVTNKVQIMEKSKQLQVFDKLVKSYTTESVEEAINSFWSTISYSFYDREVNEMCNIIAQNCELISLNA